MSILANSNAIESGGYNIERSLRFRASASAYLSRTASAPTNNLRWTWSGWVKRGKLSSYQGIFDGYNDSNNWSALHFFNDDRILFYNYVSGVDTSVETVAVFRDPSAWYHIVFVYDSSNATVADRAIIYVNGVRQTVTNTYGTITLNEGTYWNLAAQAQALGRRLDGSYYADCYMAEVNFIDGQALTPSSFGSTNATTGVWQPAKYTGTYGTNGFYLPFTDTSSTTNLVKDSSGNANNWTPNNISLTSGVDYDSMIDSPTNTVSGTQPVGNYCVGNPNYVPSNFSKLTIINGNLSWGSAATNTVASTAGTMAMTSGKYYWEVTIGAALTQSAIGIQTETNTAWRGSGTVLYGSSGNKIIAGSSSAYGATYTTNDVIGFAYDADAGTLTCYKNNVSQGVIYSSGSGSSWLPAMHNDNAGIGVTYYHNINFGQRPFAYTPPTGFVALCTSNLPTPTIVKGNTVMDATLYTGTDGVAGSVVNSAGFKPDLVWIKARGVARDNRLTDSVRGTGFNLSSNSTAAEVSSSIYVTSFNTNGFSYGTASDVSQGTMVGWQWQAGQGTTSSNTNGSITSTVSVNASAGFSVVTYTGTGANATVGHGLGVAPRMVIVKGRSVSGYSWTIWNKPTVDANGASAVLALESTSAWFSRATAFNSTAPTSTVFSLGTDLGTNTNTGTFVAYCWAEIAGFSKFGSYTGNGSADGPFIFTGFRPKFVLMKLTSSTSDWWIHDTARDPSNQSNSTLYPNGSFVEDTSSLPMDILSNGFKLRTSNSFFNGSGSTYIYAAFAENPFKNALAR